MLVYQRLVHLVRGRECFVDLTKVGPLGKRKRALCWCIKGWSTWLEEESAVLVYQRLVHLVSGRECFVGLSKAGPLGKRKRVLC